VVEARIIKYGRGMNSPKPERRNLYIEIQPEDLSEVSLVLKNVMLSWKFDTTSLEPWYKFNICKYCAQRVKYEHERFVEGKWVWNRRYCMRHYLIEHLHEITTYDDLIESNRYVELHVSKERILFDTKTVNYDYSIAINRRNATINVDYKGRVYTFKYNNHLNSLPFSSSYLILIYIVKERVADRLASLIDDVYWKMVDGQCAAFNVFIDGKLAVPACTD
jgi:hypothetical protein